MTTLHTHRVRFTEGGVAGFARARADLGSLVGDGVALVYTPRQCCFGAFRDGELDWGSRDKPEHIFEARLFSREAELRWWNDPSGGSVAVLLAERELAVPSTPQVCRGEPVPQTYLLWGTVAPADEVGAGWTRLAEPRIGVLDVPIAATEGRLVLTAVEYLAEGEDGNVFVCEERLTGIETGGDDGAR